MRDETENVGIDEIFSPAIESGKISQKIIEILKQGINSNLKIEDICGQMNYSKSYLFKRFRNETGKSIMDYYRDLKVEEAKRLLREDNLTVTEISEKLNFDTQSYFSKVFKKITGYSPLKYKRIIKM